MSEETQHMGSETPPEAPAGPSVEQTPSSDSQEPSQTPGAAPQAEAGTMEHQTSPVLPPGQQPGVDDPDVPWKNRYMESQRKLDKMETQLSAVLEKLDQSQGQKEAKYSIEELEDFIAETDNQAHKNWARGEIRRLNREENSKVVNEAIGQWKSEQQAEATKAQSLQTVMQRYPDAFTKDASGNITGWNMSSPMAQSIARYMQDPELKNHPRGLVVASAMAYSDVAHTQVQKAKVTTQQAKAEVKALQKQTLTEGGGVNPPPTPPKTPLSQAKDRLNQTGSLKDGAVAFKEMLKGRGRIKEDA